MSAADAAREATYRAAIAAAIELLWLSDPRGDRLALRAPEDPTIRDLCERVGYGAVMDSAARQWRAKGGGGAHTTGMAVTTLTGLLERLDDAMARPSPVAEALLGLARASVAYRALLLPNASEVDAELIRRHQDWKVAVDALLAVDPSWGG